MRKPTILRSGWENKEVQKKQAKIFWLNTSFEETNKGIPLQLGYGLGYKIVEAYINETADKKIALFEILATSNATAFLEKSN